MLVIVLSATLPLLAGLEFERKDLALGTVGVLIALATALRNFYQWDQLWSLLRQSDFELSYLLDRWHLDVAALENEPPEKRPAQLHALTTALRDAAEDVRRSESTGYFGSLRFPNGQQ